MSCKLCAVCICYFIISLIGVVRAVEMVQLVQLRVNFGGFEQFFVTSVYIELLKRKLSFIVNKCLFLLKYRS